MGIHLYLPIAGVSISAFALLGIGIIVGLISGLFGVGGGFLLTPLLIMMGIPPTIAAASDSNQIVAATTSGTYAHWRLGNVDIKLGLLLLVGGFFGSSIGVEIIKMLRRVGNADFLIKICYVVILGVVGSYMFMESLNSLKSRPFRKEKAKPVVTGRFEKFSGILPLKINFEKSGVTMSVFLPVIIGFIIGMLAAIMGLGGGFIMVPALIYLLRIPMHVVVGTNLFQEIFLCINVTFMQASLNHTVDFILALVLLLGSTIGAQFGARLSHRLKADQLKILLATIILFVMSDMLIRLISKPETILSIKGAF